MKMELDGMDAAQSSADLSQSQGSELESSASLSATDLAPAFTSTPATSTSGMATLTPLSPTATPPSLNSPSAFMSSISIHPLSNFTLEETLHDLLQNTHHLTQQFQLLVTTVDDRNQQFNELTHEYLRMVQASVSGLTGSVEVMTTSGKEIMRRCAELDTALQQTKEVEAQIMQTRQHCDWLEKVVRELTTENLDI